MKKRLTILLFYLFPYFFTIVKAQVIASFVTENTVCVGEELEIVNTSVGEAETYSWNFCALDLEEIPEGKSLGSLGEFDVPTFLTIVEDEGEFFGFATNFSGHYINRLDFGTDLRNEPEVTNLGSFWGIVPFALEGIQVIKEGDLWWGFFVTGYVDSPSLIRYEFGTSLYNTPTIENLGNIGDMNFPHELLIFEENGEWFGWTINVGGSTLTRFSFGDSLSNIPTGINVGNIGGLVNPTGFTTFKENGDWYMFVCNLLNNSISKLNFGTSLTNIPVGVNLGVNPAFNRPRDILFYANCGELFGLVINGDGGNEVLLDFQGFIDNIPTVIFVPAEDGLDSALSFSNLIRKDNDVFFFVASSEQQVRFELTSCHTATPQTSEEEFPPPVVYQEPGEYVIELIVNEGLDTEKRFCNSVVVISVEMDIGTDTLICEGETIELNTGISQTTWQDGSMGASYQVDEAGLYYVQADTLVCHLTDSISVDVFDCQTCLVFPNAFTPNADGHNDAFSALKGCPFELDYFELKVFNRWGELVFETSDFYQKWDGRYKGKIAASDVYIWTAQFAYPDRITGEIMNFKEVGELSLIR